MHGFVEGKTESLQGSVAISESAQRDYYEVLGIVKGAGQKAIKNAYRTLAIKYHPDRNKEPGAEARFKEIVEAYAVLSDPRKRSGYDALSFAGVAGFSTQDLFGGINFDDIFGGHDPDFGAGSDNLFEGFFSRYRQPKGPKRGANIEASISVPLERVARGGEEAVRLNYPGICPACHGSGGKDGIAPRKCDACKGSGHITHRQQEEDRHITIQRISPCPTCYGRGTFIETPCAECHGSGQVARHETLSVIIPVGIGEGMALSISGKGMPSPDEGGNPGDLLVFVHSQHDPRFERSGADLIRQETIAVTDAVLGTQRDVPTLEGTASVIIPPGTQPGTVLCLKGRGLPVFGSDQQGEMVVRLMVQVQEKLSDEARKLYERLRVLEKTGRARMW